MGMMATSEDFTYGNEHPAAKRMRIKFEDRYGSNSDGMRAANNWFNVRTQYNDAWNKDRDHPITEGDVAEAERAMLSAFSANGAEVTFAK